MAGERRTLSVQGQYKPVTGGDLPDRKLGKKGNMRPRIMGSGSDYQICGLLSTS